MIRYKKELLTLNMLQNNSKIWKNKCNDRYIHYRFMVDSQEYFLWKQYNIKTTFTNKNEFILKINNLGSMFHNPKLLYQIENNGQMYFSPIKSDIPIIIGKPFFNSPKDIKFPLKLSNNKSKCITSLENIYYLRTLMNILNFT